jgi:hypothetical protein
MRRVKMEIGSFIELQLPRGLEYYRGSGNVARLNTGRAAIWHAFKVSGAGRIWIPYYQCDSIRDFFAKKGVEMAFYHIDKNFNPIDLFDEEGDAVLLVNYYGIMSSERMRILSIDHSRVIVDNCQAFFCDPLAEALNVYSCRKFVGVPDGSYVVGPGAECGTEGYPLCYSSDTATFLLSRIEYGCEGKGYRMRHLNEARIDDEDAMRMSKLTRYILDGTDYGLIRRKRRENFEYAHGLLGDINLIDPTRFYDRDTVPMVYPLVVEDDSLLQRLQEAKHFQGHWWSYICEEQPKDSFEYWLSRYVIPITIDQRYGFEEIDYLVDIIKNR